MKFNESVSKPHYEVLSSYQDNSQISLIAQCENCPTHHVSTDNPIAEKINVTISYLGCSSLQIQIYHHSLEDYRIPDSNQYPYARIQNITPAYEKDYLVLVREKPLEISIKRKSTNQVIFKLDSYDLIFSLYMRKVTIQTSSNYIYGLGERLGSFMVDSRELVLWNRKLNLDHAPNSTTKINPTAQNGFHPVYLAYEVTNQFHTVYLRTSNAVKVQKNSTQIEFTLVNRRTLGRNFICLGQIAKTHNWVMGGQVKKRKM